MNAVIYARFSSHSQREQSIEGQLKTCYKFAADNGYTVIGEYIDRAQSGTNDNRAEFQRMIADSDKHTFNAVIVYQLDRFARNRYDSAINKAKLKKNGVRVVSARENITDDASGILVEGILESMAEYYSAELSQKIHRGMSLNAQKCLSNGSNPGLGFKVAPDHTFYVDEDEAVVVREIFERYGKGETVADIIKDLNARQIKTSLGRDFNKNSLHRLLRNKRYIGTYLYKGQETPGGMPRIVSDEVFERVQNILDKNKAAPARSRGKEEYLLTTKLFCGYCHEMMTGYGGTGKSGKAYHYYACKNAKKHLCQKKVVDKKRIEDMVVAACRQMLTDSNIQRIAEAIEAVFKSEFDSFAIKRIKTAIQETDTAIENLWQALEKGQGVDTIMERINKRQEEKAELEAQLAIEAKKERVISAQEVTHFLSVLQKSNFDDPLNRRAVINIFLNKIYLYDDKFRLVLNGSGQPVEIDNIMLDGIDDYFDSQISDLVECSSMVADAPPKQKTPPYPAVFLFYHGTRPLCLAVLLKNTSQMPQKALQYRKRSVASMNERFELVLWNSAEPADLSAFSPTEANRARAFHAGFSQYTQTPLTSLPGLAKAAGVESIQVKDESYRFGLNAFKVLGGSYALGRYIAKALGEDIKDLPANRILSDDIRQKLGQLTFVTATDGNHGRGVAWTANQLGQKSVVYMPKGSAQERLDNIRAEGSDASITDLNYDDAVRLADKHAREYGWVMVQDTAWEGYTDIPLWIMQGYTTMGAEMAEQLDEAPTHLFLQAGVGSMAGAMAGFFTALYGEKKPKIIVVEPNKADCLFRTAKADDGTLHNVTGDMDTIMAGLACGEPCSIGWDVLKACADGFLTVPESAAADGMRILAAPSRGDTPIVSGESGAAAFGAAMNILLDPALVAMKEQLELDEHSRLLFISTEGDTDKENYRRVVWGGAYAGGLR